MSVGKSTVFVRCLWASIALIGLSAEPLIAQDSSYPMTVNLESGSNVARSGGFIPVSLRVGWAGPASIVNGDLIIQVTDDYGQGFDFGHYVLEDLFISQGEQVYDITMLADSAGQIFNNRSTLEIRFQTKEGNVHQLQSLMLNPVGGGRRTMVVALGLANQDAGSAERNWVKPFAFEKFTPADRGNPSQNSARANTRSRILEPTNFPTLPLALCSNNLVVLDGKFYEKLSSNQRDALLTWVKAGGSCCLLLSKGETTTTVSFNSDQIESLNQLVSATEETPFFMKSTQGELQRVDDAESIVQRSCGLGRVVIGHLGSERDAYRTLLRPEWHAPMAFLWKFRQEQVKAVQSTTAWDWEPAKRFGKKYNNYNTSSDQYQTRNMSPVPSGGGAGLLENTLPQGMRTVPIWLMGIVLAAYILAIGPFDYLFLGAFKARFYTWGLFPLLTIAFTFAAIWMSKSFMQGTTLGGSVEIHDVVDEGQIARSHRISLEFNGSQKAVETDLNQELFVPLNHHQMGVNNIYQLRQMQRQDSRSAAPVYYGQIPVRGRVMQSIPPWTPQLNRTLQIPAQTTKVTHDFDWGAAIDPRTIEGQNALRKRVQANFPGAIAKLFHRDGFVKRDSQYPEEISLTGPSEFLTSQYEHRLIQVRTNGNEEQIYRTTDFMRVSTVREQVGFFSVVSQVSPKCDQNLEDLPILDSSDESAYVLVIGVQDRNNWTFYRKLYHVSSPE